MTDSKGSHLEDSLDRYVRRELTPEEARDLAQKSLAGAELFENLTASALAVAAVGAPPSKVVRFPRKARFLIASTIAAAIAVLIFVYPLKRNQPSQTIRPALKSSATQGQPILLATGLEAAPDSTPVFRSPEPDSRAPRPDGSVVSIEDGLPAINLGSLDGLATGSELQVYRDKKFIGSLTVTAVFRERARAQILSGIRVNDQVRTAPALYFDALLQQAEALSSRGDADAARKTVEQAAAWVETSNVPPVELERLARLEYRAGMLQGAEKHYQSALDHLTSGDQSVALNNLAVLHMLRGDYDGAEQPLNRVASISPKTDVAYARSLNNLGVLAELRRDPRKAEVFYTDALRANADLPPLERQSLETNLARIRGAR